ncbi:MAG: hypothetical protein HYX53_13065 [Chloroflexi bacterium]|nr:hypothetical protein [Chloroflexota bacterium]
MAVVLTQVFWIPNIARILRTRDVDGYSLLAWVVMTAGLSSWLVYFIARGDVVGTVANVSGVSGAALTTGLVWRWRKPKAVVATVHSIAVSKETAGEMEQAGEVA